MKTFKEFYEEGSDYLGDAIANYWNDMTKANVRPQKPRMPRLQEKQSTEDVMLYAKSLQEYETALVSYNEGHKKYLDFYNEVHTSIDRYFKERFTKIVPEKYLQKVFNRYYEISDDYEKVEYLESIERIFG